jgi:hypothetical protein
MKNNTKKNNKLHRYRRCSGRTYRDLSTGKIREYKKAENRAMSHASLMKSLKDLGRLINHNFFGEKSERHLVLTYGGEYAGCMTDTEQLYRSFKTFWQRFSYRYPGLDYIAVPEPQRSGSWHIHVLLKERHSQYLWIDREEMAKIWKNGAIHIKRLTNPQTLVGYFFKGIATGKWEEDEILDGADDNEAFMSELSQSYENFGSYELYPPGFNLYRYSNGIKKPLKEHLTHNEAIESLPVGNRRLNASTTRIILEDDDGVEKELNAITHENFKIPKTDWVFIEYANGEVKEYGAIKRKRKWV